MKKILFEKRFQILVVGLTFFLSAIGCALPFNLSSSSQNTPEAETAAPPSNNAPAEQPPPVGGTPSTTTPSTRIPSTTALNKTDPLDRLLDLHPVQFTLTTSRPDGTSRSINAQVDAAGNMHVTMEYKGYALKSLPKGFNPNMMPGSSEVYVLGGKAYRPSKQELDWMIKPVNEDFKQSLTLWLHGSDGPALWLEILPPGSIQKAGNETVGGFKAVKYLVKGMVENQNISGTLWEEPETDALVQAELHVPGALLSTPDHPQSGELKINLTAQKADIAPIKLPPAPAGTSGATPPAGATPSSEAGASPVAGGTGTPSVANVYSLAHMAFFTSKLAISPGKVWVGSLLGTVDAYDAQTGAPLQSISLFPDSGGMTPLPVQDLLYDGQNLWALAISNKELVADRLFVISPADGKILQQFDTSQWQNHDDARLGFSPGLVWTESHVIDTKTFEAKHVAHPDMPTYGYDGSGWMWIMGSFCEGCGYDIWLFNTANLQEEKYGPKAVEQTTAMTTVGNRMWVATEKTNGNITTPILQVYAADGEKTSGDTQPLQTLSPVDDHPLSLLYDGHALWLLAGGKNQGALFQLDPQSGATVNRLDIPASVEGDVPADIAFDGHNLWVLTIKQLVRISLPWG